MSTRAALILLGLACAAVPAWAADPVAQRAIEHLDAADAALAAGDVAAAERALDMAWVYLGSPLFGATHPAPLVERSRAAERQLAAWKVAPAAAGKRDEAAALLAAARGAKRPSAAAFDQVVVAAAACERTIDDAPDVDRVVRTGTGSLDEIQGACRAFTDEALAGRSEAERWARERDAAIRALLAGDRLAIYREHGEPTELGDATPQQIARAKVWIYLHGPSGNLRTYERWVFTWSGNRLVSRRRTTSHEKP